MRVIRRLTFLALIVCLPLLSAPGAFAQPREQYVKVLVAPDHPNWVYKVGEKAKFTITILYANVPVANVKVRYEIRPEKMDIIKTETLSLKAGWITIDAGTMKEPGFLQCWAYAEVEGKEYMGLAAAAFDQISIQPTTEMPKDFSEFWEKAKAEAVKIPMDAKTTLLADRSTPNVNVYHVQLQNYRPGTYLYGILCVLKKEGKFPAILRVPGAGARAYG